MDWIMVLAFFMGGVAIGAAVTERFGLRPSQHVVTIPQGGDTWITVDLGPNRPQARINLLNTDEGLILDMYGYHQDEPVATTWATDDDILQAKAGEPCSECGEFVYYGDPCSCSDYRVES